MKRLHTPFATAVLSAALGLTLAAGQQQPPPPTQPPPPPTQTPPPPAPRPGAPTTTNPQASRGAAADEQSVTVSGCIQRGLPQLGMGATGAANTSGATASTSQAANAFKLTMVRGMDAGMTAGASSTAPAQATAKATTATELALTAGPGVELAPHVNHQVEVTGMTDRNQWAARVGRAAGQGGSTMGTTDPTRTPTTPQGQSTTGATVTSATSTAYPSIRVTAVKMISATCPPPQ